MKDEIRAAIRKMKLGKAKGKISISVEPLEALEVYGKLELIRSQHYSTKSMTQIPTSSNQYLQHYQRNQGQESANCIERSVL